MIAGATAKMAAIVAWEYILVLWKMFQWRYDKRKTRKVGEEEYIRSVAFLEAFLTSIVITKAT